MVNSKKMERSDIFFELTISSGPPKDPKEPWSEATILSQGLDPRDPERSDYSFPGMDPRYPERGDYYFPGLGPRDPERSD